MEYFAKYTYFFAMMLYASALFLMFFKDNGKTDKLIKQILITAIAVHGVSLFSYIILSGYVPLHKRRQYMIPTTFGLSIILLFTWTKYKNRLLSKIVSFTVLFMFFCGFPVPLPSEMPSISCLTGIEPFLWYNVYNMAVALFAYCFCLSIAWFFSQNKNEAEAKSFIKRIHNVSLWGFVLFTFSQAAGSVWAIAEFGDYWQWKPIHLMSVAIWMFYAAMIHVKYMSGFSKKVLPLMGTIGFACIVWWGIYFDYSKNIIGFIKGVFA